MTSHTIRAYPTSYLTSRYLNLKVPLVTEVQPVPPCVRVRLNKNFHWDKKKHSLRCGNHSLHIKYGPQCLVPQGDTFVLGNAFTDFSQIRTFMDVDLFRRKNICNNGRSEIKRQQIHKHDYDWMCFCVRNLWSRQVLIFENKRECLTDKNSGNLWLPEGVKIGIYKKLPTR